MARVSFLKDGMELNAENISGSYTMGDALPVDLVEKGQEAWKNRMGYDDNAHVAAGKAWDQVRVGAQTFTAKQFLAAQKDFVPGQRASAKPVRHEQPKVIKAFEGEVPDWGIAEQISPTFREAKARIDQAAQKPHNPGPIIDAHGHIDYQATKDRDLADALKKIGAKPRPPKNDGA